MTGYRSAHFRHDCKERGCYVEGLPSWDEWIRAFPRNIRPTDVDGFVEINGHILILEEKCAGKGPGEGQRRALRTLGDLPNVTVIIFRPAGDDMEYLRFPNPDGFKRVTKGDFALKLHAWAVMADNTSPIRWASSTSPGANGRKVEEWSHA